MELFPGTILQNGKYELIRKGHDGLLSCVCLARDDAGDVVKIKTLSSLFNDEQLFKPFRNDAIFQLRHEQSILSKLSHPGIPRLLDYFEKDGVPYLVMNMIDGTRIANVCDILDLAKVWNKIVPVLNYVHSQGVVHSDISPGNILVTGNGEIALIDFGISDSPMNGERVYPDFTWGTKEFMSPEQVLTPKQVDYRSDYYSLARTFIYLLSGHSPKNNGWAEGSGGLSDYDTAPDIVFRGDVCDCLENLEGCPQDWQEFLKPYLAKDPKWRPRSLMQKEAKSMT